MSWLNRSCHFMRCNVKCEAAELKTLCFKFFRYFSFLLEGDARHTEEGLADFLGAFNVGDLEEALG